MGKLKEKRGNEWLPCLRSSKYKEGSGKSKSSPDVKQEIVLLNSYLSSLEKKIDLIRSFPKKLHVREDKSPIKSVNYEDLIQQLISGSEKKKRILKSARPPVISDESSAAVIPSKERAFFTSQDFVHRHDQTYFPYESHVAETVEIPRRFRTRPIGPLSCTSACLVRYIRGDSPESHRLEIEFDNERLQGQTKGLIQLKEIDCSSHVIHSEMIGRIVSYLLGMISATAVPDTIV